MRLSIWKGVWWRGGGDPLVSDKSGNTEDEIINTGSDKLGVEKDVLETKIDEGVNGIGMGSDGMGQGFLIPDDPSVSDKSGNTEDEIINTGSDSLGVEKDMLETKIDEGVTGIGMDLDGQGFLIPDDPPQREMELYPCDQSVKESQESCKGDVGIGLTKCSMLMETCDDTIDEAGLDNMSSGEMDAPDCEEGPQEGWQ
jgi:hypothetical protein